MLDLSHAFLFIQVSQASSPPPFGTCVLLVYFSFVDLDVQWLLILIKLILYCYMSSFV